VHLVEAHLAVTSGKMTASPLMVYFARRRRRQLGSARRQCLNVAWPAERTSGPPWCGATWRTMVLMIIEANYW